MALALPTRRELIFADLPEGDGPTLLRRLAALVAASGAVKDADELARHLIERELLGSTAIGGGVAIPHCKLPGLEQPVVAVGLSPQGVEFGAPDGRPARVFFLVISPENDPGEHLRSLAAISRWLRSGGHAERVAALADPQAILDVLTAEEHA